MRSRKLDETGRIKAVSSIQFRGRRVSVAERVEKRRN